MKKPFNITLMQPHGYLHAQALTEAAEYVHAMLLRCGESAILSSNRISASHHNIVFCAHLLSAEHAKILPADTIVFNSEQLDNEEGWYLKNGAYAALLQRFTVWDYSANNLPLIPHARKAALPFWFCPELVRTCPPHPKSPGLLFYGCVTPRREKLLREIAASGVPVTPLFGRYGVERDQMMRSAWAVLNLHNSDNVRCFESIRCFHPLINGVPVISEDEARDPSAEPFRDFLHFFRTQDLAAGINALFTDKPGFRSAVEAKLTSFRTSDPAPAFHAALAAYLLAT